MLTLFKLNTMIPDYAYLDKRLITINNRLGLSNKMLDFDWVDRQVRKKRLAYGYKETITKLVPILESIYPNRWDIQYNITIKYFSPANNLYRPVELNEPLYEEYIEAYRSEENIIDYYSRSTLRYHKYVIAMYREIALGNNVPLGIEISNVNIVIHFPEITITNSNQDSLVIKDIFTSTQLFSDGTISIELKGARTTFTIEEMVTGYVHSHLKTLHWAEGLGRPHSRMKYTEFCLGNGELITFAQLYNGD